MFFLPIINLKEIKIMLSSTSEKLSSEDESFFFQSVWICLLHLIVEHNSKCKINTMPVKYQSGLHINFFTRYMFSTFKLLNIFSLRKINSWFNSIFLKIILTSFQSFNITHILIKPCICFVFLFKHYLKEVISYDIQHEENQ